MATKLYFNPFVPAFSNIGVPIAQSKLYFYLTGTTTPATIYSDAAMTTPLANPVQSNLAGKYPDIYLNEATIYKVVQTDKDNVPIGDAVDPYIPGQALKGDPGGNAMSVGVFTAISGLTIAIGIDLIQTSGYSTVGIGSAIYAYDATVDAAYVAANPRTAVRTANGRGFKLAVKEVDVRQVGAIGDGIVDDGPAIQAATNTGLPVFFSEGDYFIGTPITKTGQIIWRGLSGNKSTIIADTNFLTVTSGSGSYVGGLNLINKTMPWTILRDPENWSAVPAVTQKNTGYQPTINDTDVWAGLTLAQQNQQIGPTILFVGDSEGILVEKITGRFVVIGIYDSRYSTFREIDIHGGKGGTGALFFWNINSQSGIGNRAENIHVEFSSFNGVVFARNIDGFALGIQAERCGESGLKFWKGTLSGNDARCYNMTVANCKSNRCYFDGFDLCGDIPFVSTTRLSYTISGIESYGCHGTGINIDGSGHVLAGFKAWLNGDKGWWGNTTASSYNGLVFITNNVKNSGSNHEMTEAGSGNTITNVVLTCDPAKTHSSIYATGTNRWVNVSATGRPLFFGSPGSIVARLCNVTDDQTGAGRLHNASVSDYVGGLDERGISLWPLRTVATVPSGVVSGILTNNTPSAEYSIITNYVARNGALTQAYLGRGTPSINVPFFWSSGPSASPPDVEIPNSGIVMYLDEAGNNLKFKVKYSNGTVKVGTLAVV